MSLTDTRPRAPLWQRSLFRLPILGWMARDLVYGPKDTIWYTLATVLCAWASAVIWFGLPGLYIPALCMVPAMFITLLAITRG